ncbi:hypothetical protein PUNSTDRAFT_134892 [Punctularia strigosozonata HHB-11173 SS5]|uniref:uncharacterized protein n=1 Tax=Punctularia strigosozonata (strain HHB-11173) TaxID=741275 RepID=UPI00044175C6|nr:uncharacterized protein PUNSTDRAFT_134892 [Punctularia strigosozonata HHB-11173 SS5]EIN08514.1 hypothetical protein PUNSTDRAFT_134892 [Punctularia strigosozonata HHB-11173 SS5]
MRTDAELTHAGQLIRAHPADYLGSWLMGCLFSMLLQGVVLAQASHYVECYRKHTRTSHCFVSIVALLNTLRTVQSIAIIWNQSITDFGDYDAVARSPWYLETQPLLTELIGFVVQTYFAMRVARMVPRRKWLILVPILLCMLVALGGGIAMTVVIFTMHGAPDKVTENKIPVVINLSGTLAADSIITGTIVVVLWRSQTALDGHNVIDRLIAVTWTSAAPPFLCALLNLVLYVSMSQRSVWFVFFNLTLSYLYSVSMMYTINSRPDSTSPRPSVPSSGRKPQPEAIALSTLRQRRSDAPEPGLRYYSAFSEPSMNSSHRSRTPAHECAGRLRKSPDLSSGVNVVGDREMQKPSAFFDIGELNGRVRVREPANGSALLGILKLYDRFNPVGR